MEPIRVSRDLLARYGGAIPRYTSYPTAPVWRALGPDEAENVLKSRAESDEPLSVYVHLPFCRKLCFYCGCTMMVTRSNNLVERYLSALEQEIARVGKVLGKRKVVQLHWGGGTPTYLNPEQLTRVHNAISAQFQFTPDAEQSIEIHPPVTTFEQMKTLRKLGFNRVSMGVQDFDREVQEAVNRIQPFEQTRDLVKASRDLGFRSVNIDLMYGLPHQTVEKFAATLDKVAELRPDRVALFGYAHLPQLKPHQKLIDAKALPVPDARVSIFESAVERLMAIGYRYIGLDHFALEEDDLSKAQQDGTLRRDFMGYTTCAESELIAFGASSISEIGGAYLQNQKTVTGYIEAVEKGGLPTDRGMQLSADDLARQKIIHDIFCRLEVDTRRLGQRLGVDFDSTYADELQRLQPLAADGLIELSPGHIKIKPTGQILLRNVAAVFDAYLRKPSEKQIAFSRAV